MDIPYADVDRIAKMIPATIGITLDKVLDESGPLQEAYEKEIQVRELIDTALKLEGLVRNSGVHAAGVVISPMPLTDLVPLHKTKNDEIVTAFDMKAVEKMGLLKMDFLGLTTLTILDDTLKLIAQTAGLTIKLDDIPLSDEETYARVFHRGLTSGVFQFESHGMRDVLRRYPPKKIEKIFDLMAQFAGYGFNKSHSAAYALLAYHTAYLKTHYPVEFMAALLTSVTGNTDEVVKYINECREMGIAVEPPDINVSDANFTPHGAAIRFGLAAVKNVGHNAIESIALARKGLDRFSSIFEFCEKV